MNKSIFHVGDKVVVINKESWFKGCVFKVLDTEAGIIVENPNGGKLLFFEKELDLEAAHV